MKSIIKQLLRERLLTKDEKDIIDVADFVNFAKKYLGIKDEIKIELAYEKLPQLKTTAYYELGKKIVVYAKDRAIIDVCRSISHEMEHHRQFINGELTDTHKQGQDGSEIENAANSVAGKIIRIYGKLHPELYV
jgi:hypothetical protein